MAGMQDAARIPRPGRRSGAEPPGYERVSSAFRRSARILFLVAGLAAAGGLALIAGGLFGMGGAAMRVFVSAGAFLCVLSLLPFLSAWRRRRRATFLAALRARWTQLAHAGDPHDQIAPLARSYAGMVGNDLAIRVTAPR